MEDMDFKEVSLGDLLSVVVNLGQIRVFDYDTKATLYSGENREYNSDLRKLWSRKVNYVARSGEGITIGLSSKQLNGAEQMSVT